MARRSTFDESTREAIASRLHAHILPTFGPIQLRQIKPSSVQAWLRGRQQECAPRYVKVMLANLSSILGAAVEDGLIAKNACRSSAVSKVKIDQRKIVPWSLERVEAVIAAHPERYRAVPIVAAGAGLRQGEVFGLRVEDVDFLKRKLHVRQQVKLLNGRPTIAPPKRGKTREVPLADVVAVALAERIRAYPPDDDGLIFTSRERKPLTRTYYNPHIWKPALVAADVEPTRANGMHALRHYFASVILDAGESIRALADYLGHSDPGFTLRTYTHMMPTSEDRARRAVDDVLGSESIGKREVAR
jgi:integrase